MFTFSNHRHENFGPLFTVLQAVIPYRPSSFANSPSAATGVISTVRCAASAIPARGRTAARSSVTVSIPTFIAIAHSQRVASYRPAPKIGSRLMPGKSAAVRLRRFSIALTNLRLNSSS